MTSVFSAPIGAQPVQPASRSDVALHPLVAMGLSDHYTAATIVTGTAKKGIPIIGIVLGRRQKRDVEVCSTFELIPNPSVITMGGGMVATLASSSLQHQQSAGTQSSSASSEAAGNNTASATAGKSSTTTVFPFDAEAAVQRRDMAKALYPSHDVVGWYVMAASITEGFFDAVNEAVKNVFEVDGPLALVADMSSSSSASTASGAMAMMRASSSEGGASNNANGGNNTSSAAGKPFPINVLETLTDDLIKKSGTANIPSASEKAKKINFSFTSTESERIGTDMLFRLESDGAAPTGGGNTAGTTTAKKAATANATKQQQGADASSSSSAAGGGRSLEPVANRLSNSVSLLHRSITTVAAYLEAVQNGTIANPDTELLRSLMGVVRALPAGGSYYGGGNGNNSSSTSNNNDNRNNSSSSRGSAADRDYTESLLLAYASVIQKAAASLNTLQNQTTAMVDAQQDYDERRRRQLERSMNNAEGGGGEGGDGGKRGGMGALGGGGGGRYSNVGGAVGRGIATLFGGGGAHGAAGHRGGGDYDDDAY